MLLLAVVGFAYLLPVAKCDDKLETNITKSWCEYPFQGINNGCYYFSEAQMDFDSAVSYCAVLARENVYAINLAVLDYDRDDDQAVLDTVAAMDKTYWFGGKAGDNVHWYWLTGQDIYILAPFWAYGEPNEADNKCVAAESVTIPNSLKRGYLFDHDCDDSLNFICQMTTCPIDFVKIGNYCYLKSWTIGIPDLSWQFARNYCQSLAVNDGYHSDLAVFSLPDQADYHLMNALVSNRVGPAWIGVHKDTDCHFKWIDGRELPILSIYWSDSNPDCGSYNSVYLYRNHGSMNRAYLGDEHGGNSYPFICQMVQDIKEDSRA